MKIVSFALIAVMAAPIGARAESDSAVPYQDAKEIFPVGEQDYCLKGRYEAKKEDKWLALISNNLESALVEAYVDKLGVVTAQTGAPQFFLKGDAVPMRPGRVTSAAVTHHGADISSQARTVFSFGSSKWRFIERGGSDITFYL